jgi:hypothetical protein
VGVGEKTLVQLCAERGLDTYLRILVAQGADPNSYTARTRATGLLLAAKAGHPAVIQGGHIKGLEHFIYVVPYIVNKVKLLPSSEV